MDYYRIILVDDEEEVRKAIISNIQWERLGFRMIGDAENGEEALELIEQLEPDVVMTDIRMPYMDGLTLARRIRQKYPSVKILIFSGYDDFEYAQQAIKLNVTEYILKPVNGEELTEILGRVRSNLDEEIEQRRNVALLQESYQKSLPIIREMFLNDLVRGKIEAEDIRPRLAEYGIDILDAAKWIAMVIDVEKTEAAGSKALSLHQEWKLIPISVMRLVEDQLKGYCRFAIFNSSSGISILAAIDEANTQTGFINLLGDICKECKRILELTITIGVGDGCDSLEQVSASYQAAVDALGYRAIVGTGSPIYINDVEPVSRGKLILDSRDETALIAAIKFGPPEKIRAAARLIAGRMDGAKVHARQYQAYMLSVVNCLTRLVQQYDLNLAEIFDPEQNYFNLPETLLDPAYFEEWIVRAGSRLNAVMNQKRDNTTKQVVMQAREYIQEHYRNPDLSVETICQQLHLSPAYFSTIFKKETGQTYIAYLTELRLSKAVELLQETDDKTYVIAAKVGYQEQNYFSYVFKKRFGVSPTKFRGA